MHCVYITRHSSGLFYIGKSQPNRIAKGYKGSGIKLNRFWKSELFKKDSWEVEIIFTSQNAEDCFLKEKQLIAENKGHTRCLNLAEGGIGGSGMTGHKHSDETKSLMKEKSKAAFNTPEIKRQRSERMKLFWANPENRKSRRASMNTPEAHKNRSEAGVKRHSKTL